VSVEQKVANIAGALPTLEMPVEVFLTTLLDSPASLGFLATLLLFRPQTLLLDPLQATPFRGDPLLPDGQSRHVEVGDKGIQAFLDALSLRITPGTAYTQVLAVDKEGETTTKDVVWLLAVPPHPIVEIIPLEALGRLRVRIADDIELLSKPDRDPLVVHEYARDVRLLVGIRGLLLPALRASGNRGYLHPQAPDLESSEEGVHDAQSSLKGVRRDLQIQAP
jgi:hypothetical protein